MRRVMLVDDEPNVLHALQRMLRRCIFDSELRIEIFADPSLALERAAQVDFDVVISDYGMPRMNGVLFLQKLRPIRPDAVRIVLSASTEFETVMQAVNQAEVFRYLPKPWSQAELQEAVGLALARRDAVDALGLQLGRLTPQEIAEKQLEAEEPGITRVNWGPDGSVHFD